METAWLAHAQSTPAAPSVSVVTPAPSASPAPAPPPLSPTEAWIKKSKEPFAWWKWSADLRIRDEFQNNASSLTNDHAVAPRHKQNYQRLRLRFGNVFTPIKDVDLNLRLTIESRNWMKDTASPPIHKGWDWNEVVFEYAHIRLKNLGGSPITITAGRQDLQFGEGFLIFEGTPLDGSRTMYFDALRATCE
ncbi:MAG: hypothetical protein MUF51_01615, partial [Vicinamibacteria bacterium]|nr:hypothetical protein [Vicinamibacteria bacterium]